MKASSVMPRQVINGLESVLPVLSANDVILACQLEGCGFFDSEYYLREYPDVAAGGLDPALHYARLGIYENRSPAPWFKPGWAYADCVNSGAGQDVGSYLHWLLMMGKKPPAMEEKAAANKGAKKQPAREAERTGDKLAINRQGAPNFIYDNPLEVNWALTHMCNYKCSYCFGQSPLDKRKFSTFRQLKTAVDHVEQANRAWYNFTLSGGEPTTHPYFFDLLEYIHKKMGKRLNNVLVISNGSRNNELYKNLRQLARDINLKLFISLHTEFMDLEHITSLIEDLSDRVFLRFNLMFNPEKRDFAHEVYDRLLKERQKNPFYLNIGYLRKPPAFDIMDDRYTEEDFHWHDEAQERFIKLAAEGPQYQGPVAPHEDDFFVEYVQKGKPHYQEFSARERDELFKKGYFNFKNMHCALGSSLVSISHTGAVRGAVCKLAPQKYNIYEENPFLKDDFCFNIKCDLENCGCRSNDIIPKFASREDAAAFMYVYKNRLLA